MKNRYNLPWPPRKTDNASGFTRSHKAWGRKVNAQDGKGKEYNTWEWYFQMRQDAKDGKYG